MNDQNTCVSCRFWEKREQHSDYGLCRRNPPIFIREADPSVTVRDAAWLTTRWNDWCGKWKRLKEKTA